MVMSRSSRLQAAEDFHPLKTTFTVTLVCPDTLRSVVPVEDVRRSGRPTASTRHVCGVGAEEEEAMKRRRAVYHRQVAPNPAR